jgi:hypothetical protein
MRSTPGSRAAIRAAMRASVAQPTVGQRPVKVVLVLFRAFGFGMAPDGKIFHRVRFLPMEMFKRERAR